MVLKDSCLFDPQGRAVRGSGVGGGVFDGGGWLSGLSSSTVIGGWSRTEFWAIVGTVRKLSLPNGGRREITAC